MGFIAIISRTEGGARDSRSSNRMVLTKGVSGCVDRPSDDEENLLST